jgi:hypothetical protein
LSCRNLARHSLLSSHHWPISADTAVGSSPDRHSSTASSASIPLHPHLLGHPQFSHHHHSIVSAVRSARTPDPIIHPIRPAPTQRVSVALAAEHPSPPGLQRHRLTCHRLTSVTHQQPSQSSLVRLQSSVSPRFPSPRIQLFIIFAALSLGESFLTSRTTPHHAGSSSRVHLSPSHHHP